MERDIKDSRFLEHGEYDGNLYGTKIDSIHQVVAAGRTCILDINPQASGQLAAETLDQEGEWWGWVGRGLFSDVCWNCVQALKVLKTAEFMPFVVFIAAPELDTLRNMHKAVVDAGLTTKLLTVSLTGNLDHPPLSSRPFQFQAHILVL